MISFNLQRKKTMHAQNYDWCLGGFTLIFVIQGNMLNILRNKINTYILKKFPSIFNHIKTIFEQNNKCASPIKPKSDETIF